MEIKKLHIQFVQRTIKLESDVSTQNYERHSIENLLLTFKNGLNS